jgi:DNA-binding CsgD family transcriptional regulator
MSNLSLPTARSETPKLPPLTPRQLEILHWVREGKTNWEIGAILNCSAETVKKHLQRIYRRLGVENRVAALNCLRE